MIPSAATLHKRYPLESDDAIRVRTLAIELANQDTRGGDLGVKVELICAYLHRMTCPVCIMGEGHKRADSKA